MITTAQKAKLVGAAAALAALLGVAYSVATHNSGVVATLADAGLSHGSQVTDLATAEVQPNGEATTGVTLPFGSTGIDVIAPPQFEVLSTETENRPLGLYVRVRVRNKSQAPLRFIAYVSFDPPAGDAGP